MVVIKGLGPPFLNCKKINYFHPDSLFKQVSHILEQALVVCPITENGKIFNSTVDVM